ncbi:uncharacterized protein KY384_005584 [Bacidia gigantensis]|uniref:uncharacterized protein n=1 Tax=Bacidia gigantensis TaxID=2732470 RepID=UPI001D04D360|nr:uncharacterized protein KY384_005584 [Bacidia gigantensis]KAG8530102.1 hypothetical protein KY384_005584 [Bacidia gigantensis]
MLPYITLLLLSLLPSTLQTTPPSPQQTASIFTHTPNNPPSFSPLATLTYNPFDPSTARTLSLTPPKNTTDLTSIAVFSPPHTSKPSAKGTFRSSVTATRGFHAPYKGRFTVVVSVDGDEVLGVSWRSWPSKEGGKGKGSDKGKGKGKGGKGEVEGRGDFDIVVQARAPVPVLDSKGGKGQVKATGAEGEEGEEKDERSFIQK